MYYYSCVQPLPSHVEKSLVTWQYTNIHLPKVLWEGGMRLSYHSRLRLSCCMVCKCRHLDTCILNGCWWILAHQISEVIHLQGEAVLVCVLVVVFNVLHVGHPDGMPSQLFSLIFIAFTMVCLPQVPLLGKLNRGMTRAECQWRG